MSDPESRPRSRRGTVVFLVGVALIAVLAFVPVWKCPPCEGTGKRSVLALDCIVCKAKGRVSAIPTLGEYYWASFKFRSPVH